MPLRYIVALVFLGIGCGATFGAQPAELTPAQRQQKVQERERLVVEGNQFIADRNWDSVIAVGEKIAALDRALSDHSNLLRTLGELAKLQEFRANFPAARLALREMFEVQVQRHGLDHWKSTDGRLALEHLEQRSRLTADQRRDLRGAGRSLEQAAKQYQDGKSAAAAELARQATAVYKTLLGEEHPDYATSITLLAVFSQDQNQFAQAEPLFRQALAIRKQVLGEAHPLYAMSLANLGMLYRPLYDARAEPLLRQALAIRKRTLGEKHTDYAGSLGNLAELYQAQGDFARAEALYQEALAIRREVFGEQHPEYAALVHELGALCQEKGDLLRAEALYRQALAIWQKTRGEGHPLCAAALSSLATLAAAQGDATRAEALYRRALDIQRQAYGEQHATYASGLNNLAALYWQQRDLARAEPLLVQSLSIFRKVLGERYAGPGLNNLAALHTARGEYAKAEALYRQALESKRDTTGVRTADYALTLTNLGALYWTQGDQAQAEPLCRQSLALLKEVVGERHPHVGQALTNLALVRAAQGQQALAVSLAQQNLELTRHLLDLAATSQSERQQLRMAETVRHRLDDFLDFALASQLAGDQAYAPVLGWKGAILAGQRGLPFATAADAAAPLAQELRSTTSHLASLLFTTPGPQHAEAFRQRVADLTERKERLEADLARQNVAFRTAQAQRRLQPADVHKALPAGTALLDFLEFRHASSAANHPGKRQFEQRLLVFVLRPGAAPRWLDLGPVAPIAQAIDPWRQTLATRTQPIQGPDDPALVLRKRIWEPLAKHLEGVQTVLVSPDGPLNRLPFGALPGAQAGTFLLEERSFVVVPVPQLLPELLAARPAPAGAPTLLVVGGVAYGAATGRSDPAGTRGPAVVAGPTDTGRPRWDDLPASGPEAQAVRARFADKFPQGQAELLRGDAATETAIRRLAPQQRFLHLATHGFFAPPHLRSALLPGEKALEPEAFGREGFGGHHPGLLSGLVLAGANRPVQADHDDGILTAAEVALLDLRGLELAVLSACETGLGNVAGGEGVLGLQRAFQVAGARSVVTSLWKVDDEATAALMALFYHKLWQENLSPVAALRAAQLTLLQHPERLGPLARERGPNFDKVVKLPVVPPSPVGGAPTAERAPVKLWGAFVLSGAWR